MADRTLAEMSGRIYRLATQGSKPQAPQYRVQRPQGAARALKSPNLEARYLGWESLKEMQGEAEETLLKIWNGKNPRFRARALPLLARIPGKADHYVQRGIRDKSPDIRIAALRIARERKLELPRFVSQLVRDPSPQVRRECAIALRLVPSNLAAELWAELALQHNGKDRWYLEALGIGAHGQEDRFFSAWLEKAGDDWDNKAGRDIVWRSRSKKTPALLVQLIKNDSLPKSEKLRYFRAMDFLEGPEKEAALIDLLTYDPNGLE